LPSLPFVIVAVVLVFTTDEHLMNWPFSFLQPAVFATFVPLEQRASRHHVAPMPVGRTGRLTPG